MIIDLAPQISKNGIVSLTGSSKKKDQLPESAFKGSDDEKTITTHVLSRFALMDAVKNKPNRELNNMSFMQRQSMDQVRFNSYQFTDSQDPDDDWKSNAVRPITRNKVISIAAHLTKSVIIPHIFAENEQNQDDKDAALVMRDLLEWTLDNSQPQWERTFMFAVIAAMVNPLVVVHTEYAEVYRTVKIPIEDSSEKEVTSEDGGEAAENPKPKYTTKKILDTEYSGFVDTITPLDEFWWPDSYQYDVQRQPDLIRRRVITYEESLEKHGNKPNFKYVKPGVQCLYVDSTNLFYESYDENLRGSLVEEIVYHARLQDLDITFCNGIIMDDYDRPNPRQDKKYPYWTMGYEIVDEGKFIGHKSLVNKLGPDEEVVQVLYRMIIDGSFLDLYPSAAIFGDEAADASIFSPGTITTFSENTKVQPLNIRQSGALQAGMQVLSKVEDSMNESSVRDLQQGNRMTAVAVQAIEAQIETLLGLFGRMIGFGVKQFADLRISDILQYMTLGETMDILSETDNLKFRSFIMNDRIVGGKKKSRRISFKPDIFGKDSITQEEKDNYEFKLRDKAGDDTEIIEADPELYCKLKFKTKVTADIVTPKSDVTVKALNLEEYDRAVANPLADQQAIFRDLLLGSYDATKGDPDKYIQKPPQQGLGAAIGAAPGAPAPAGAPGQGNPTQAPGNSATAMMANQASQQSAAQLIKK